MFVGEFYNYVRFVERFFEIVIWRKIAYGKVFIRKRDEDEV